MTFLDFFPYSDCSDRHAQPRMMRARRGRNLTWYGPGYGVNIFGNGPRLPICKPEEPEDSYGWVDVVCTHLGGHETISNRQLLQGQIDIVQS